MIRRFPHGCGLLGRQLVQMLHYPVHRAVSAHQLPGSYLAYALDSRNIVRRIPPDGQDVHHLRRRADAEFFAESLTVHGLVLRTALARLDLEDMVGYELAQVLVRGDHIDIEALSAPLSGHRAYNVIGLVSGNHEHRDTERAYYLRQRFEGVLDDFGGRLTVGLVLGVSLVAECPARGIEGHCQM